MDKNTKFGVLYIVATPIGNLDDISKRALKILSSVDLCAAEDTKKSRILFNAYNIKTKITSYEKFNESKKLQYLISFLKSGKSIALISDAGTPLISDPGYLLVKKAHRVKIKVVPVPGPSSLISALSVSGLPLDKFVFYGFAPRQRTAQVKFLKKVLANQETSVFFESKVRILSFLKSLFEVDPDRNIFVAREMTKLYETFYSGKVYEILELFKLNKESIKGEFVLVIEGKRKQEIQDLLNEDQLEILNILEKHMKKKDAASLIAKSFGSNKKSIYNLIAKKNRI
tara:strand:+ start:182 stop:1036 length:855 start_codon:yes stop_codon:yes gene_type:complete